MKVSYLSCESASVEECVESFTKKAERIFGGTGCYVSSAELKLTFGAFMHLSASLVLDPYRVGGGVVVEYSSGRDRESTVEEVLGVINARLKRADVVAFKIGTYTTPVTRRTYAVGVAVYNRGGIHSDEVQETPERRKLLAHVLSLFNYNPKVLNISELARTFDVSRDTIYYDIQQILKEKAESAGVEGGRRG
ncbi:HTH domain-containing protein [Thermococcus sp. Bubb.Bath]|uniref:HTH domain-containing protein n=1 Tax=Thermococcus sp. Bubb.Bath TaxID=1638242 RepID=UPI00143C1552|nr:HTH domain-containing protein [Thermococcus sp. Bubb.Bath]NJF25932.1 HTH domain-containing protein [Thermococcus sp. Bubb.Bath]